MWHSVTQRAPPQGQPLEPQPREGSTVAPVQYLSPIKHPDTFTKPPQITKIHMSIDMQLVMTAHVSGIL